MAVLNESILAELEASKFSILDEVREKTGAHSATLTLSIGIGASVPSLKNLAHLRSRVLTLPSDEAGIR